MKRRKVLWARSARRDLEAIVTYVADRSPQAALTSLERLEGKAKSLALSADRGRIVPELARLHVGNGRHGDRAGRASSGAATTATSPSATNGSGRSGGQATGTTMRTAMTSTRRRRTSEVSTSS